MSHPYKIFTVSFHKSGTTSLHHFLQRCGISSHHYPKALDGVDYIGRVAEAADEPRAVVSVLHPIILAFDAHCDAPWAGLVPELVERFPTAHFIYLRRNPEQWWESLARHWQLDLTGRYLSAFEYVQYRRFMGTERRRLYSRLDKDFFISAFHMQAEHVAQTVPPERLLIVDLKDPGIAGKLSSFLGLKGDVEFPHLPPSSAGKPVKRLYNTVRQRILGSDLMRKR